VLTERSYRQYCGVARALDLVGERWALLVVRELALGPKRFTDLRQGLPGIATNILSLRLRQLERDGIVTRRRLPPPAPAQVYVLTEHGRELVPIMLALGRWGASMMGPRSPEQAIRAEWLALALQAFFDIEAAEGLTARIGLDLDGARFTLQLDENGLAVVPGEDGPVDLAITADPEVLIQFLAGAPVSVRAEGDPELLARLPALFPLGPVRRASLPTVADRITGQP
jgi:DNA-binding HxlR family transcriptional regulator